MSRSLRVTAVLRGDELGLIRSAEQHAAHGACLTWSSGAHPDETPVRALAAIRADEDALVMELHTGERLVFEGHPSWRALLSFYLGGFAVAAAVALLVALIADVLLAIVVGAVIAAGVIAFGLVKRTATTYLVSNQRLYIRRGMLSKRVQQTRIDRVQNVNTEQSFRERLLRVGTVDFDTAGTDDSEFRFVGIAEPDAVVRAIDAAQREAATRSG